MKSNYHDIIEKAGEPLWYDDHGVPRYVKFHPDECGVYIDAVALVKVRCQACDREFLVADEIDETDIQMAGVPGWSLKPPKPASGQIGSFHYGDPPIHESDGKGKHCIAGNTMNTYPVEVVEFWQKGTSWILERHPECEGPVNPKGNWWEHIEGLSCDDESAESVLSDIT